MIRFRAARTAVLWLFVAALCSPSSATPLASPAVHGFQGAALAQATALGREGFRLEPDGSVGRQAGGAVPATAIAARGFAFSPEQGWTVSRGRTAPAEALLAVLRGLPPAPAAAAPAQHSFVDREAIKLSISRALDQASGVARNVALSGTARPLGDLPAGPPFNAAAKVPPAPPPDPVYPTGTVRFNGVDLPTVALRPDRPIEPVLVQAIDAAKSSIEIAGYEFNLRSMLAALRRARDRGVRVRIVLDFSSVYPRRRADSDYVPQRSLEIQSLINEGFDVQVLRGGGRYGIQHAKFMLLDGRVAQFGSYNYTWTSEKHHYEAVEFTDKKSEVQAVGAYWKFLRSQAIPFGPARDHDWPLDPKVAPEAARRTVAFNDARLPAFFFSPGKGEDWLVTAIGAAKRSVDLSAFSLRSARIAEALLAAKARGVAVRVVLDRSQMQSSGLFGDWLAYKGIDVRSIAGPNPGANELYEKNHNKFMVLDRKLVESGSMNFTKNGALMNFEDGHFNADPTAAKAYGAFFAGLYGRAQPVSKPKDEPKLPTDEELVNEVRGPPEPAPAPVPWASLPAARSVSFHGASLPSFAMRPHQPIAPLLIQAIGASRQTIRLALYELKLPELADALRAANKRGVDIEVVLDYPQAFPSGRDHAGRPRRRGPEVQAIIEAGIDVRLVRGVGSSGSMHNKFAIFDGKLLQVGSYNWAVTAEKAHYENVIFTEERSRIDFYQAYWRYLVGLSTPVRQAEKRERRPVPPAPPVATAGFLAFNGVQLPHAAVSPNGIVESVMVQAIGAARDRVDVAMFSFYSEPLGQALVEAKKRGVKVRVLVDRGQAKLMKLDNWLAGLGVEVKAIGGPNDDGNAMFEKQHNKFMILDGKLVETGSYNFTGAAQTSNFDNANFFVDADIAAGFGAYFEDMFRRGWAVRAFKPR